MEFPDSEYDSESMSGGEDSDPEYFIAKFAWSVLRLRVSQLPDPTIFLNCREMLKAMVENELAAEESDEDEVRAARKHKGLSQTDARVRWYCEGEQIRIDFQCPVSFAL